MNFTSTTELIELQPDVKINITSCSPTNQSLGNNLTTIVFLHFWGGSASTWSVVNQSIAGSYPTIAIDFRGWGASTGPDVKTAYSISHLADDVESVLHRKAIKNFIIVGHSMGGKVAQVVAGRGNVAGLQGLVLVAPAPPTPFVLPGEMLDQQIHAYDNAGSAEFVTRNVLTGGTLPDAAVAALVKDMLKGNSWARAAWPDYAMQEDVSSLAEKITVPTLVAASEGDKVEPLARIRSELVPKVGQAKVVVLQDCGHMVPLEAPQALTTLIKDFTISVQ